MHVTNKNDRYYGLRSPIYSKLAKLVTALRAIKSDLGANYVDTHLFGFYCFIFFGIFYPRIFIRASQALKLSGHFISEINLRVNASSLACAFYPPFIKIVVLIELNIFRSFIIQD